MGRPTKRRKQNTKAGPNRALKNLLILLILVGLGIAVYASREPIKDRVNLIQSSPSLEGISNEQPAASPTIEEEGDLFSAIVIETKPSSEPTRNPDPASTNKPTPTLTAERIFGLYDSGEISLEEAKELLKASTSKESINSLSYEGKANHPLIDQSKSILERVWREEAQGRNLIVTFTYSPIYDPSTDEFNFLGWEETNKGQATIVIPEDQNEYSAGVVFASTFMVLTLELTDNPNQASIEELQKIYKYATEDEYQEALRCSEELELTYCSIFIAGYPQETAQVSTPTRAIPNTPTQRPTAPATLEMGRAEWVTALETTIHALINQERQKASLSALDNDPELSDIARLHSQDMARNNYFSHDNLKGQGPTDRANQANYECRKDLGGGWYSEGIAENIVQGYTYSSTTYINGIPRRNYSTMDEVAEQLVHSWMTSPGHRQNILDKQYDRSGLGVAVDPDGKVYSTQNFC